MGDNSPPLAPPSVVTSATPAAPASRPPLIHHTQLARRQYAWVAGAALVLGAIVHWLGPVLTPFLIGAILAYLGHPIVRRCESLGLSRTVGTLVAVLVMGVLVYGLMLVIVPLVQEEVALVARRLPELTDEFTNRVTPWLSSTLGVEIKLDLAAAKRLLAENAESAKTLSLHMLSGVSSGGRLMLVIIVNAALTPVVMFYLLRDWNPILDRIDDLIPRRWVSVVRHLSRDVDHVLSEFLHGQMLVMVSLAAYYSLALWIAGLNFAVPIGILTGLLVFIPYVGFGTGFVLGMLAALLQWHGLPGFLAILAVYGIGQLLENYVLIPYLVGQRIGLHPLGVIFALMAFGQLFGFAGVLLALPVSAAILVGLRHLRDTYRHSPMYLEP